MPPLADPDTCASIDEGGYLPRPGATDTTVAPVAGVVSSMQYTLAPNPSDGRVVIHQTPVVDGPVHVTVRSMLGATVYEGEISFSGGQSGLTVGAVANGMYVLELIAKGQQPVIFKMVISR